VPATVNHAIRDTVSCIVQWFIRHQGTEWLHASCWYGGSI